MRTQDYLAGIALSRALFDVLLQDAIGMLPPVFEDGDHLPFERLESHLTIADLSERLHVSPSTVRADLRRLVNYGWVTSNLPRHLGRRQGARLYLIADVQAEAATGVKHLVSEPHAPAPTVDPTPTPPPAPQPGIGRGSARKWVK